MEKRVKIVCQNIQGTMEVAWGTSLAEVAAQIGNEKGHPYLAAYVNNSIRELDYRIADPVSVKFIDITHFAGMRVYQRTLFITLHKAVHDLYPDHTFKITQSVSRGFYCEIEGIVSTPEVVASIKRRMDELIAANLPIVRHKMLHDEAIATYRNLGFEDKIEILSSRPPSTLRSTRLTIWQATSTVFWPPRRATCTSTTWPFTTMASTLPYPSAPPPTSWSQ